MEAGLAITQDRREGPDTRDKVSDRQPDSDYRATPKVKT